MRNNNKGFTLIELLVVVAIIGTLAAVGVVAYNGYTAAAKKNSTKAIHANVVKYIASELAKCGLSEDAEIFGSEGTVDASTGVVTPGTINSDSKPSEIVGHLATESSSPLQDKNPYTGAFAVVNNSTAKGFASLKATDDAAGTTGDIEINTQYSATTTDLLTNKVEVE